MNLGGYGLERIMILDRDNPKGHRRSILLCACFGAFPLLLVALVSGCPGKLADPDRFLDGGEFACPDIPTELFPQSCGGNKICHEGAEAAAGLDLVSPGVVERVVDKKARDCPGILADPVLPEASLLFTKLSPATACGSPMPLGKPAFSEAEKDCLRDWIEAQTPTAPPPDMDAGMDAPTD